MWLALGDNGTVHYFVTDHLGSTTKLINTNGSEYSEMKYLSWGMDNMTPPGIGTSFKYTGQRQAEAGLYFYNARYYDPELGRFIQVDTFIPSHAPRGVASRGNPLAWDRYAYAFNNPITYNDPTGHMISDGCTSDEGCNLTSYTAQQEAQKYVVLERQAEMQSRLNNNSEYRTAGDLIFDINKKAEKGWNETKETIFRSGATLFDYLEFLDKVKLPGVSFILEFNAQKARDEDLPYSYVEKEARAYSVGFESQITSGVSAFLGGIAMGATSPVPPASVPVGVLVYGGVSIAISAIFDSYNELILFPLFDEYIN
jgi:RHS repeat-associated protein